MSKSNKVRPDKDSHARRMIKLANMIERAEWLIRQSMAREARARIAMQQSHRLIQQLYGSMPADFTPRPNAQPEAADRTGSTPE